jgi:hypothetical protein
VQTKVVKRRHVFRDYGLTTERQPGARGYLGVGNFMRLEDFKAKCKKGLDMRYCAYEL